MTTDVAKVYGGALYDLAAEEGLEDELLTQQQTLTQVLAAEPQWLRLLAIPSIPKPERTALLDEALTGVHPYLVNFSKILCERESIGELPACFKEYLRRYNKAHGILTAVATAAVPMTEEQKARLTYDNILRLSDDPDVNDAIKFLRAREIVHFQRFGEGLRLAKDRLNEKNVYFMNPSFDK